MVKKDVVMVLDAAELAVGDDLEGQEPSKPVEVEGQASSSSGSCVTLKCLLVFLLLVLLLVVAALVLVVMGGLEGPSTSDSPTPSPTNSPTVFPTASPTLPVGNCQGQGLNDHMSTGVEYRDPGNYMGVVFTTCVTTAVFDIFIAASRRWSSIVAENLVRPTVSAANFSPQDICGSDFSITETYVSTGDVLDHLTVFAEITAIDGDGGILGGAFPCALDLASKFPIFGGMIFDDVDVEGLISENAFDDVVFHEMGHVMGIGSLWTFQQDGGAAETEAAQLLQDRMILGQSFFGNIANPDAHPNFIGEQGLEEFGLLLDASGLEQETPLRLYAEDGRFADGSRFFDPTFDGAGSIDSHWKISVFDKELMTWAINPSFPEHPLSEVSLMSLKDLGYAINEGLADDFTLPEVSWFDAEFNPQADAAAPALRNSLMKRNGWKDTTGAGYIFLDNDIPNTFNPLDLRPLNEMLKVKRKPVSVKHKPVKPTL